jgi:hypothetical protein
VDFSVEVFGKNEQVKKVFWTLFVAMAGLVLVWVVDPVTVQKMMGIIAFLSAKILHDGTWREYINVYDLC